MWKKFLKPVIAIALILLPFPSAYAQDKLKVIASFSILGDMVKNVAGDDIDLKVLVGANSDTHEYQPAPADAIAIANADIVFINGLGLEGWVDRLIKSSGYKGKLVKATAGISPLESAKTNGHRHGQDPHAWQDVKNGIIYVTNIRDALIEADKAHADDYRKNATAYIKKLEELDNWVRAEIAKVPAEKRMVISTHDAFKYFARAYEVDFLAAQGMNTEAQPSAANIASLINQVRDQKVKAVFLENMADSRLIKQLEKDGGAHIGGTLYSDAISAPDGPAPSYIGMFKHNVPALVEAMLKN
jgi:zinc/manganese transport system substrate-binding protein